MEKITSVTLPLDTSKSLDTYNFEIKELTKIFEKIGVTMEITESKDSLVFKYDISNVNKKLGRQAGRNKRQLQRNVQVQEIRERMKNESADEIAKTLGLSRATLFRRLKNAEENNLPYI